jgi:hypothetical protein
MYWWDTVWSGSSLVTFRRNIMTPYSRSKLKLKMETARSPETSVNFNHNTWSHILRFFVVQYRLLRAVTWRYVSSHYSGSVPLSCFYGGRLLDKFLRILQLACESSGDVKFGSYNVRWISDLCTRFMDHFEDITEPQFNTDYSVSGSKIIDLLDCIMDDGGITGACEQTVTVNKTECNIRALYRCVHMCPGRYTDRGKVPYLQCHLLAYTEN